jgi:hypothetical protein
MYLESHHQPIVYAHLKMCPHDSEHIVMHDAFASIACETNFHMMQKVMTKYGSTITFMPNVIIICDTHDYMTT